MTNDIDPIEEIHKIRKAMYAEAGGTPAGFVRYLRTLEKMRKKSTKRTVASPVRKNGKGRKAIVS